MNKKPVEMSISYHRQKNLVKDLIGWVSNMVGIKPENLQIE